MSQKNPKKFGRHRSRAVFDRRSRRLGFVIKGSVFALPISAVTIIFFKLAGRLVEFPWWGLGPVCVSLALVAFWAAWLDFNPFDFEWKRKPGKTNAYCPTCRQIMWPGDVLSDIGRYLDLYLSIGARVAAHGRDVTGVLAAFALLVVGHEDARYDAREEIEGCDVIPEKQKEEILTGANVLRRLRESVRPMGCQVEDVLGQPERFDELEKHELFWCPDCKVGSCKTCASWASDAVSPAIEYACPECLSNKISPVEA